MPNKHDLFLRSIRAKRDLSFLDLCSVDDMSIDDIALIFDVARAFKKLGNKKYSLLLAKTIFHVFFEDSTRTRSSFELAGKKLGADVINISAKDTSVNKGESLHDTAQTLNALGADILVIRTSKSGIPYFLSQHIHASVINAGDGIHEHPTQALLDAFTLLETFGKLDQKTLLIVGDIKHSRVFGSLARLLKKLRVKMRVCAPQTLLPPKLQEVFPCEVFFDIETAIKNVDAVYALRVQEERGSTGFIPSLREYASLFCITAQRLSKAKKNAILLHPGPVIRGIDIANDLVSSPQSKILTQVANGLAIRSALEWLLAERLDRKKKKITSL